MEAGQRPVFTSASRPPTFGCRRLSPCLVKGCLNSHSDVADLHDVPELSRSEALSPSDSVDSCLVDDDFPFHECLRSRSPSCSSMNGPSDREGTKGLSERKDN